MGYISWDRQKEFSTFKGMTFTKIEGTEGDDEMSFFNDKGEQYKMLHDQD